MNVFDYAIRLEERGVQLFELLKHDSENHELKEIFDSLATMEQEHLTSLRTMKQVVTPEEAKSTMVDRAWPVKDGFFETGAGSGSIVTREKFGDVQLHLEWATPSPGRGANQDRGTSLVYPAPGQPGSARKQTSANPG